MNIFRTLAPEGVQVLSKASQGKECCVKGDIAKNWSGPCTFTVLPLTSTLRNPHS